MFGRMQVTGTYCRKTRIHLPKHLRNRLAPQAIMIDNRRNSHLATADVRWDRSNQFAKPAAWVPVPLL
jgi:hypothetical protein